MGCLYIITNKINNKRYIGKTMLCLSERKRQHIQHARLNDTNGLIHKAIRKYGTESFEWVNLYTCNDENELGVMELILIRQLNTIPHNGYNLTGGGEGKSGKIISESHKIKIQIFNQGKKHGHTSGFVGVHLMPITGKNKWRSVICYNRKSISLGCYKSEIEAALAYNIKAIKLYGDKAKINKIQHNV